VPAALIKIVTATLINQQKAHKKCQFKVQEIFSIRHHLNASQSNLM